MFFPGGRILCRVVGVLIEFYRVNESLQLEGATGGTCGEATVLSFICVWSEKAGGGSYWIVSQGKEFRKGCVPTEDTVRT